MTTATIGWVFPTERTDVPPTPLPITEIASTEIFDAVNGAPPALIATVPAPATTFTTASLVPGTHVFTLVCVDVEGNMAAPSAPVSETVPAPTLAPPAPITGVTVTLNP